VPRTAAANRELRVRQRANLLGAARRLLLQAERPLTMESLAIEAGVSQGLAYRYFPSKEALFRALVAEMLHTTTALTDRVDDLPGGPREKIRLIVTQVLEQRRQNPEFYRFMFQSMAAGRLPAAVRRVMHERGAAFRSGLRALIVAGQEAGEISRDDPDELVTALTACIQGLWRQIGRAAADGRPVTIPRADLVLRLLGPAPVSLGGKGEVPAVPSMPQRARPRALPASPRGRGPRANLSQGTRTLFNSGRTRRRVGASP
jgi:AcrR family transcriptional regulator